MNTVFQTLKDDVDYQAIATRMNVTVYGYELSDGSIGHCLIALTDTNKWMLSNGDIVDVVKLVNKYEPETTGHHEIKRFFHGFKSDETAQEFCQRVTERYVNTHYYVENKYSYKLGHACIVTVSNLTDDQLSEFYKNFPVSYENGE